MLKGYSLSHPAVRVSAVYFSDHGENVYDEGDYCGHNYADRIPRANVEIPFVLWFSPSQREFLKAHNSLIESRLHTPYMIDDLFHTIIDLSSIATPCFDKTRSFINPDYDSTRQRVLEDGSVYVQK
jgi:heptose-I-phosphate ethanolaminephosphotransferase